MLRRFHQAMRFACPTLARVPQANFARQTQWNLQKVEEYKKVKSEATHSESFENEDRVQFTKFLTFKYTSNKLYHEMQNKWKNNLIRKAKRREIRLATAVAKEDIPHDHPKLVIHSPLYREIQVNDETRYNSFAVISLNGSQHKVTQEDTLVVPRLNGFNVGDVIIADNVHLIGSQYFTILGRPLVPHAKIYLTVEQQCLSSKVIVFKKKRRKGYRKSQGHRARLTVLKVNKIEYDIDEDLASRAVKIWDN
jgi:large subunit ribosomal protein L21